MIIDKILDRKELHDNGKWYEWRAFDFYCYCNGNGTYGNNIARALDAGTNEDIKLELLIYCNDNGYATPEIVNFIKSVDWLQE